ncbi:MAG: hypothetical protein K2O78_05505 [Muribaculaceae bacterium]|nr:hypothetical protein [Muribaculaceae bacterium]
MPDRFKTPLNKPEGITPEDYARARNYVEAIKAIGQIAYESIYIIDYFKGNFLYVSPNPLLLCGLTPDEVMELGYGFYTTHVPKDELKLLLKINAVGFQFFSKQPKEERHLFSISYDFHIVNKGESVLVSHKLTPLAMDKMDTCGLAYVMCPSRTTIAPEIFRFAKLGNPTTGVMNPTLINGLKGKASNLRTEKKKSSCCLQED